ncbi:hypothetical protein NMY22_g8711 [Coprinellus aureogranulatus]|nr:hypothetical protein NMY22_g8711 [Coprinellus aureogranulatus]
MHLHLVPSSFGSPAAYTVIKEFISAVIYFLTSNYDDAAREMETLEAFGKYHRSDSNKFTLRTSKVDEQAIEPLLDRQVGLGNPFLVPDDNREYETYWRELHGIPLEGATYHLFPPFDPYGLAEDDDDYYDEYEEEYEDDDHWDAYGWDGSTALEGVPGSDDDFDPLGESGEKHPWEDEGGLEEDEGAGMAYEEESTFEDHVQTGVMYFDEPVDAFEADGLGYAIDEACHDYDAEYSANPWLGEAGHFEEGEEEEGVEGLYDNDDQGQAEDIHEYEEDVPDEPYEYDIDEEQDQGDFFYVQDHGLGVDIDEGVGDTYHYDENASEEPLVYDIDADGGHEEFYDYDGGAEVEGGSYASPDILDSLSDGDYDSPGYAGYSDYGDFEGGDGGDYDYDYD